MKTLDSLIREGVIFNEEYPLSLLQPAAVGGFLKLSVRR